jgi:hypothetical protein
MDIEAIKKELWKVSVEFVKNSNTMIGRYTYEDLVDDLYFAAKRRNICDDLQLFEFETNDKNHQATFQFSPNYLNREVEMLYAGMGTIKWKLILPKAIQRAEGDETQSNFEGIEEEIIEKLAISTIQIIHFQKEQEFEILEFKKSLNL